MGTEPNIKSFKIQTERAIQYSVTQEFSPGSFGVYEGGNLLKAVEAFDKEQPDIGKGVALEVFFGQPYSTGGNLSGVRSLDLDEQRLAADGYSIVIDRYEKPALPEKATKK